MSKGPEAQTQKLILDWLAAKGILAFRMQTGATMSSYNGRTRMVRYGVPGMADVLAFPRSLDYVYQGQSRHKADPVVWIECKAPKGKQSDLQKSFQQQVESHGHRYIVVTTLDDVIAALEGSSRA